MKKTGFYWFYYVYVYNYEYKGGDVHMADLRPQMMIFVTEYLRNGNNATQAAVAAGYSEKTAASQGSRLLKSVEIQQYLNKTEQNLNKDLRQMFAEDAVKAYEVLKNVMNDPLTPPKDRITAARDLLDRAGYKPVDQLKADIDASVTINIGIPDQEE